MSRVTMTPFDWVVLAVMMAAYFAPSIMGATRRIDGLGRLFALNLFFGWTFAIWAVLLFAARYAAPTDEARPARRRLVRAEPRLTGGPQF